MAWAWPVPNHVPWEVPNNGHPGSFGVIRKHDIHTGIDLYAPVGSPIHAVESGLVVRVGDFTGPAAGSDWWLPTRYLLVKGISGVVCYGEMQESPEIVPGAEILKSQKLGTVQQVLRQDKGVNPTSMLHLELYDPGFEEEPVWWKLEMPRPEGLRDPTKPLRQAWLGVTNRHHRDIPPLPNEPQARKELIRWILDHRLWKHPVTLQHPPEGRDREWHTIEGSDGEKIYQMEQPGPDWEPYEFLSGSLQECVEFFFVYVNPTTERWEDAEDLNTDFRVWVEGGGWYDQSNEADEIPVPEGGWNRWNKWIGCHDILLDCRGKDIEEALLALALRVRWHYADGRDARPDVPKRCTSAWDRILNKGIYACRDAGDGFCKLCGYDMDADCAHPDIAPSKTYPDGSVDGACVACGEEGFPLADVDYESFSKTPEGQYRCTLRRMVEKGLTYPEALRVTLSEMPEGIEGSQEPNPQ